MRKLLLLLIPLLIVARGVDMEVVRHVMGKMRSYEFPEFHVYYLDADSVIIVYVRTDSIDAQHGVFDVSLQGDSSNFNHAVLGLTLVDSLMAKTSIWWYCKYMDAINISPGGSGATEVLPDGNTVGGHRLDAATEYLYFNGGACNNWDSISDLVVKVRYEVNIDNSAGGVNDTVELDLLCYYKGNGETTNKTQTVNSRVEVGQSAQYKMFTAEFTINYDLVSHVVQRGDVLAFKLNLDTVNSDVDNIIVNFARFKYKQKVPQPTTY